MENDPKTIEKGWKVEAPVGFLQGLMVPRAVWHAQDLVEGSQGRMRPFPRVRTTLATWLRPRRRFQTSHGAHQTLSKALDSTRSSRSLRGPDWVARAPAARTGPCCPRRAQAPRCSTATHGSASPRPSLATKTYIYINIRYTIISTILYI